MGTTQKEVTHFDYQQTLKRSFNDADHGMLTSSFLAAKVGRKIVQTIATTTVANDTIIFDYMENSINLYTIKVVYTDGTQSVMLSCERTA